MSGQVPEAFPILRSCLEYALYAHHIFTNPALEEVWLRRHDDQDTYRASRREFQHFRVAESLRRCDEDLCAIIEQLYERTIDFGAHPNERAITSSLILDRGDGQTEMQQIYLHGGSDALDLALKSTAQVGLGSLCTFRFGFRERFALLGIDETIHELRQEL